MGLFKKRGEASPVAADDDALELCAAMLRIAGDYAFDVDTTTADDTQQRCQRWSRHLLTLSDAEDGRRKWAEVRMFWRNHRKEEQKYVDRSLTGLRDVVHRFVAGLRDLVAADRAIDARIDNALQDLEQAADSGDLQVLQRQVGSVVASIRGQLEQRAQQTELHLKELGREIRNLRADLVDARKRLQVDALTGVFNRGAFDEALERYVAIASLAGQPLGLLMIDIDHFKRFNDQYGHRAGDAVLAAFGLTLTRTFLARDDLVARYGGEEFVVILNDTRLADTQMLADRLLKAVRTLRVEHGGETFSVTCSVGFASLGAEEDAASFVDRADAALYRAKHSGRNRADPAEAWTMAPRLVAAS